MPGPGVIASTMAARRNGTSVIGMAVSSDAHRLPSPCKFVDPREPCMTRYVIDPDVALALAMDETEIPAKHQLLAPTLLRSQVLAILYDQVRRGELGQKEAERRLDYLRALNI